MMTARDHGEWVLAVLSFADAGSADFDAFGSSYLIGREIVIRYDAGNELYLGIWVFVLFFVESLNILLRDTVRVS